MDGNTSFSSVFELDQSHINNYDQQNDQQNQSQPAHVNHTHTSNSNQQSQNDQSQPQAPDQQLPSEAPQPSPAQLGVQYQVQGNRSVYQAGPEGPAQFPPQSPYNNFKFQNDSNRPTQFPPQSPQAQHVPVHKVKMTQPVQLSNFHYQQTNPVYSNEAYQQGTQTRSIHPPGPDQNMGPHVGASPHPAGYPSAPSPVTFPPDSSGVPAGFGAAPGHTNVAAHGFPVQNHGPAPVIVIQPPQGGPTEGWRSGLFDCMDDPNNAIITACCPCITFGQIAEIIDKGNTSCSTSGFLYGLIAFCIAIPCIMSCTYRTKLRSMYRLVESPAPDWVTHVFCEWCALCQEYRELQRRGLDPSIGWQGNVARGQQHVNMMPPVRQNMMA